MTADWPIAQDERCEHERMVLLATDCGAGGTQYRRYCTTCWRSSAAIPKRVAMQLARGEPVPGDRELLQAARDAWWRRAYQ